MTRTRTTTLTVLTALLWAACGGDTEVDLGDAGPDERAAMNDRDDLRALHSQYLDRKPILLDLPEELVAVANACAIDEQHSLCQWGRENLSRADWDRIREAQAEEQRRATEQEEMLDACRRGDEAQLRSMYPGHHAFFELISTPPAFEEQPRDAVITIGISSNIGFKARRVLESGLAKERLDVQYGGPRLRDFSPNQYAAQNNTENHFRGYYTPEITARIEAAESREPCARMRNTAFIQAACRRDIAVSVVRDWLEARGHESVRFLVSGQSAWPEYRVLIDRVLPGVDAAIDPDFDRTLSRESTFLREICLMRDGGEIWLDYEFYVATLFPDG